MSQLYLYFLYYFVTPPRQEEIYLLLYYVRSFMCTDRMGGYEPASHGRSAPVTQRLPTHPAHRPERRLFDNKRRKTWTPVL